MNILSVSNLNLSILEHKILKDVSLTVRKGEIVGLAGESGSGKSMTALAVLNLLPSTSKKSGRILFKEQCISHYSDAEMCSIRGDKISLIFQEPLTALNPLKTIKAQVAEPLLIHRKHTKSEAFELASETLNRVGIPIKLINRDIYPHEISGGQQQRVLIAKGFAVKPKLIIADEPTTSLDVTTQAGIIKLLENLVHEDGLSLLLITHDLAVLSQCAHRVAIMKAGTIIDEGKIEDVFRQRKSPYTRKLLGSVNYSPKKKSRPSKKVLLKVDNISSSYLGSESLFASDQAKLQVLKNVTFQIFEGEILGVVGESGSGKSTLVKAILGLHKYESGSIVFNNKIIDADKYTDLKTRSLMQVVFQDPYSSFNPRHRVSRLIAEPFHLFKGKFAKSEIRDRVETSLKEVGLSNDDVNRFIHEFSGGQRQRIAIARALIIKPKLIILDEAVSSLDVSIKAQILDLLVEIAKKHSLSYLFVSHDLSVVQNFSHRVIVMQNGIVVEKGTASKILSTPEAEYTKKLVKAIPRIPNGWLSGE